MAGHSRPKEGVASLAYVPAIHVLGAARKNRGCPGLRLAGAASAAQAGRARAWRVSRY